MRDANAQIRVVCLQKMAVDRARSGEIGIRPSERRRQVEEAQLAAGGGGGYGAPKADGYGVQTSHHNPFPTVLTLLQAHDSNMRLHCWLRCMQRQADTAHTLRFHFPACRHMLGAPPLLAPILACAARAGGCLYPSLKWYSLCMRG